MIKPGDEDSVIFRPTNLAAIRANFFLQSEL